MKLSTELGQIFSRDSKVALSPLDHLTLSSPGSEHPPVLQEQNMEATSCYREEE